MTDVMRGVAHAKVNLVLEVLGVRPDGYHEIDTILQELELSDRIELRPSDSWAIRVSGPYALATPADDSNLAWRAARSLGERVGCSETFAIHLHKNIPAAGGLGGGAADAAAVLKLLAGYWPEATQETVREVANSIGSDEAFFLCGGTARAQGRGERVSPLSSLPQHDVVVFIPPTTIPMKTAAMFAAIDQHAFDDGAVATAFAARTPSEFSSALAFNAFERVAFDLFPWLAELWEDLEARIGEPVRLAGAGPCLFWIGPLGEGRRVERAADGAECAIVLTRTVAAR